MDELLELTREIESGATLATRKLNNVKIALFNIRICVANIEETSDTRALGTIADRLANAIETIEQFTKDGIKASKRMQEIIESEEQ